MYTGNDSSLLKFYAFLDTLLLLILQITEANISICVSCNFIDNEQELTFMPKTGEEFLKKLTGEALTLRNPLQALRSAIKRYIEVRKAMLTTHSWSFAGYSFRGGAGPEGGFLFNRRKTEVNVALMESAVEIIDDNSISDVHKISRLEDLYEQLTVKGEARVLLSHFFSMVSESGASLYIPHQFLSEAGEEEEPFERSVFISGGQRYRRSTFIGEGVQGGASRFQSSGAHNLIVKEPHPHLTAGPERLTVTDESKKEAVFFAEVYSMLGPKYLSNFEPLPSEFMDLENLKSGIKVVIPEITGMPLIQFTNRKSGDKDYSWDNLFRGIFDFLYDLHQMGIAHCDCHSKNVIVTDQLGSIFMIDYGISVRKSVDSVSGAVNDDFLKGCYKDLAMTLVLLYRARVRHQQRCKFSESPQVDLLEARTKFDFKRWVGHGDELAPNFNTFIQNILVQAKHICTQWQIPTPPFDKNSVNKAKIEPTS